MSVKLNILAHHTKLRAKRKTLRFKDEVKRRKTRPHIQELNEHPDSRPAHLAAKVDPLGDGGDQYERNYKKNRLTND